MKTVVPKIHYPFNKGISPYIDLLGQWSERCIREEYSELSDEAREISLKTNYGDVAAYYYPTASYEKAFPICRWMIYVGCYDDTFGTMDRRILEPMNQLIDQVYHGKDPSRADSDLGMQFLRQVKIITREFRPFATPAWERRFAASNRLFLEALVTATAYNYKKLVRYPSLQEYLRIRQNIVAVYPCTNMAEIVADFILPPLLVDHPVIKRINQLTTLLMAFCNDFFSVERERRDRETMNLILVLESERGCSLKEAYAEAMELNNQFVNEFVELRNSLPEMLELNEPLERYVSTLELMIHGNLQWHLTTSRHKV